MYKELLNYPPGRHCYKASGVGFLPHPHGITIGLGPREFTRPRLWPWRSRARPGVRGLPHKKPKASRPRADLLMAVRADPNFYLLLGTPR